MPNARISGDYDGIGVLKLTNRLEVSGSAPNIRMLDTTSGQYSARLRVDSNNAYFDSSTDDVNFGEVFRFELDAKVGYVNNSKIHTDSNHNHLSIGTSASSARSALGLGNLATENWSDLVYNGSSNTNTTFPIGDTVLASTNSAPARNGVQSIYIYDELNYQYTNNSGSSAGTLSGTWRFKGGANSMGLWRRTA